MSDPRRRLARCRVAAEAFVAEMEAEATAEEMDGDLRTAQDIRAVSNATKHAAMVRFKDRSEAG